MTNPRDEARAALAADGPGKVRPAEARVRAALRALLDETEPTARHDHSNDAKVWCVTHQHTHIASIPRFTYQCKACGWGQWYTPDALAHEASCPGHETYEVEHVTVPMPAEPTPDEREALTKQFADLLFEQGLRSPESTKAVIAFKEVAAGFHRQGTTDDSEWEYGVTWEPAMDFTDDVPCRYAGGDTAESALEVGRRLARQGQETKVWKRREGHVTPPGDWEPVEAAEAARD